ncbi:hypothetical protein GMSM_21560 [Geomonas sp. Red276]
MPLLLGTKGKDILEWRASNELIDGIRESLERRWGRSSTRKAEGVIREYLALLDGELAFEEEFARELAALNDAADDAPGSPELRALLRRHQELVSAYFRRRGSVLAMTGSCNRFHDRVLARATALARSRMASLGQGEPPTYALLVSGDRGRCEQTLVSDNRYLLLYQEDSPRALLFSRQLTEALKESGILTGDHLFWHGPLSRWRVIVEGSSPSISDDDFPRSPLVDAPHEFPEWEWRLEAICDLAFAGGDQKLAATALEAARAALLEERYRAAFMQLARRIITLPLALGRFGRWRLEKEGDHRGELDLQQLALSPLVMTVRVLAVQAGIAPGGTVERVQALLERGALSVDLSDRLLKAYQLLMQMKIQWEVTTGERGAYLNTEELGSEEDERLRGVLDTVLSLQKISYQRLVGMA